jgi:hypothetical protein
VHWFNEQRLHGHCGDVPPAEFATAFSAAYRATPQGLETNSPSLHQTQGASTGGPQTHSQFSAGGDEVEGNPTEGLSRRPLRVHERSDGTGWRCAQTPTPERHDAERDEGDSATRFGHAAPGLTLAEGDDRAIYRGC